MQTLMKKLQNFAEFRRKLPISRNASHFAKRRNWVGHYTNDFLMFSVMSGWMIRPLRCRN